MNEDFTASGTDFIFPPSSSPSTDITVMTIDDEILEGNADIIFRLVTDITALPGLIVNMINDTITIIDDEGDWPISMEFIFLSVACTIYMSLLPLQ